MDDIIYLTFRQAISLLPNEEMIHTFRSITDVLIGADWKRSTLIDAIRFGKPQIGGKMCRDQGYGLVIFTGNNPLFIETKKGLIDKIEKRSKGNG